MVSLELASALADELDSAADVRLGSVLTQAQVVLVVEWDSVLDMRLGSDQVWM